jgi:hypothetical protein
MYVGWLLAFWSTPTMTVSHLVFAAAMTTYILIAIRHEERGLAAAHADYADYRRRVPMLVPCIAVSQKYRDTLARRFRCPGSNTEEPTRQRAM